MNRRQFIKVAARGMVNRASLAVVEAPSECDEQVG